MTKQRLWLAFSLALLVCLPVPLSAQVDFQSLIPKMQALLKDVSCPASASAQSCANFRGMVQNGSLELTAQFAPAFLDPKVHLYLIYVVFENSMDTVWVISADVGHSDNGTMLHTASYGEYQGGQMVTGAAGGDVLVTNGATTWSSSKDGVTVSYYETGNTSMTSGESWKGSDGGTRTVTISVDKTDPATASQAPDTITLESPDGRVVHTGTALKFTSAYFARFGQ